MSNRLPSALSTGFVAMLLAACAPESPFATDSRDAAERGATLAAAVAGAQAPGAAPAILGAGMAADSVQVPVPLRSQDAIASHVDRGDLVGYDRVRPLQRQGGHTFHPVRVSEAHALAAISTGVLHLTGPDGRRVDLSYERHVEHPSGDWSWIGRDQNGIEGILTFGDKAVFGVLPYGHDDMLRLTTHAGQTWLATTAKGVLSPLQQRIRAGLVGPDYLVPKADAAVSMTGTEAEAAQELVDGLPIDTAGISAERAPGDVNIDVLLGYTAGFASMMGGTSQAQTRLNHLITVGNQAFVNSSVAVTLRLVGTMQVGYADTGSNQTALEQLTGSDGTSSVTVPASLRPLREAREARGADLVALVRRFRDSDHDGCGIAWLIGGDRTEIQPGHEAYGYAAISDSNGMQAPDNGHFCRDETLVHEIGHNMGSHHDREAAMDEDTGEQEYGRYAYSFGLKTSAADGNFHTVMAYGDAGQTAWRIFSNPDSTYCGGRACGVANQADNARSLRNTAPTIAAFRAAVNVNQGPHLYAIKRNGTNSTELHILSGAHSYSRFQRQLATALARTGDGHGWAFRLGDYNRDGVQDLYAIKKNGGSGKTEMHVLNGASNFKTFLLQTATLLHSTGTDTRWQFDLADYNGDGHLDLYAVKRMGGSGNTEIHILSGASKFKSFLLQTSTAFGGTGSDLGWKFEVGDYNRDGKPDLYAIKRNGGSGNTEVHVLNAASRFKSFLLQTATLLPSTGRLDDWDFKLGDLNSDGRLDLYAIEKMGPGTTMVHVIDGNSRFKEFLLNGATPLHPTGSNATWQFELVGP